MPLDVSDGVQPTVPHAACPVEKATVGQWSLEGQFERQLSMAPLHFRHLLQPALLPDVQLALFTLQHMSCCLQQPSVQPLAFALSSQLSSNIVFPLHHPGPQ